MRVLIIEDDPKVAGAVKAGPRRDETDFLKSRWKP